MSKLFSYKSFGASIAIAVVYIIVTIYLMNFDLVRNTIIGDYPLWYKGKLLLALLEGMWTSMTGSALTILVTISLLTGVNFSLVVGRLKELKKVGKLRFVIGGSSLLGIVGSGCVACGLPILAFIGLGGSAVYLPLKGMELSYLSVLLLLLSFYFLTRTSTDQSCAIRA